MSQVVSVTDPSLLFASNPMVIVVSDVHLGCRDNLHAEFLKFLKLTNEMYQGGKLTQLKVFLMTGDFIDIMYDSIRDLAREKMNTAIYSELVELHNRGVEIVTQFGNHEVSIFGKFKKAKERILKEFSKYNPDVPFLNESRVCQYATMEVLPDSSRVLKLFDEKQDVKKGKAIATINLPIGANSSHQKYLFTHGHWFTPSISIVSEFFMWATLRESPDFCKEFLLYLFYYNKEDLKEKDINIA